jgi:hypothetical protein
MALTKCSECGHEVSEDARGCASCGHALKPMTHAGLIVLVLSLACIAGAFMPWVSMGALSHSGVSGGDGIVVLVGAGLALLASMAALAKRELGRGLASIVLIGGGIAGAVGIYDLAGVQAELGELSSNPFGGLVSVGAGLYICALAGSLLALAGLLKLIVGKDSLR